MVKWRGIIAVVAAAATTFYWMHAFYWMYGPRRVTTISPAFGPLSNWVLARLRNCPRSHSSEMAELESEPSLPDKGKSLVFKQELLLIFSLHADFSHRGLLFNSFNVLMELCSFFNILREHIQMPSKCSHLGMVKTEFPLSCFLPLRLLSFLQTQFLPQSLAWLLLAQPG